jgi:hypothetical protein
MIASDCRAKLGGSTTNVEPDEFSCADTSGSDQVAGCDGQPPGKREASDGAAETDVIISAAELDSRRKLIDV